MMEYGRIVRWEETAGVLLATDVGGLHGWSRRGDTPLKDARQKKNQSR